MHEAVIQWVTECLPDTARPLVLEFGGANINGSLKHLFSESKHIVVDMQDGDEVDYVHDCRTYLHPQRADIVVCVGTAEHCPQWQRLITNAARNMHNDSIFIFTAAGPAFARHSAWGNDADPSSQLEHYENVYPGPLTEVAEHAFTWHRIETRNQNKDICMIAGFTA